RDDGIELRFDVSAHHVREGHAQCAAKHEIRNDPQGRQENAEPKKKNRQRKPFDAAEIGGEARLRGRKNRLKKTFTKNPVINDRPVKKPAEPRRSVNLAAPLRGPGRTEKDQMLETKERFRFAVSVLLF